MNYLRLFNDNASYNNEKYDLDCPSISCVKNNEINDRIRYCNDANLDYSTKYLTFKALEDGNFTLTIPSSVNTSYMTSVSYSTDNGETWTTTNNSSEAVTITTPTITAGNKVLWKGIGKQTSTNPDSAYSAVFSATGNFNASGNIMSLLYGDEFEDVTEFPTGSVYTFAHLFDSNTKIQKANNLILPATTLVLQCYQNMFTGCTSLTTAPVLPATTLANLCYYYMFNGCTSLTTAPSTLPATTLVLQCYQGMFSGCTSLTTAPELPATTLANYCYYNMFNGCASLTTAPELSATTLAQYCYYYMFSGCTSLTTAPVLPATTLANYCYAFMFRNCTGLTTIPQNMLPATTLVTYCYSNMFSGCTSLTTIPQNMLPATTLATYCYNAMFYGCTSLTNSPTLPATTLSAWCYYQMFNGTNALPDCTNIDFTNRSVVISGGMRGLFCGTKVTYNDLLEILPLDENNKPCLPANPGGNSYNSMFRDCTMLVTPPELPATTLGSSQSYIYMFMGCTSLTTAPVLPAATLTQSCYYSMFSGCTSLNYIKMMATDISAVNCLTGWVYDVAATGTFVKNSAAEWDVTGTSGVPSGWTVQTASE